jgi:hypothetical protein
MFQGGRLAFLAILDIKLSLGAFLGSLCTTFSLVSTNFSLTTLSSLLSCTGFIGGTSGIRLEARVKGSDVGGVTICL